jgi:hypothetical protein
VRRVWMIMIDDDDDDDVDDDDGADGRSVLESESPLSMSV